MNLYNIRNLNKKTQKQVAIDIGITPKTYNNYENENTEPDFKTLLKLANYFHVSTDYLLGHECPNKLDITSLTAEQKELVKIIQQLNQDNCRLLNAYANGLMEAQKKQDEIIKKFINLN